MAEPTRTELLLTNLLDNPDDNLARYAFADYVIECDEDNRLAAAKARLVHALKTLDEGSDRGGCESAWEMFNDSLTDPYLDLVGPGRRIMPQVKALQLKALTEHTASGGCCHLRYGSPLCRCMSQAVACDLRLGFVETVRLSVDELRDNILNDVLARNPLKRLVVEGAYLVVEIDRRRDGSEHNGWQTYFYDKNLDGYRTGDYLHFESFAHRQEMVSGLTERVMSVLFSRVFGYSAVPVMTAQQQAEATRRYTGATSGRAPTGRASSSNPSNQNIPRPRRPRPRL